MSQTTIETGSFRDRAGRVFYANGQIYRALNAEALADWEQLQAGKFFARAAGQGKFVATERIQPADEGLDVSGIGDWAGYLRHERIPFISYPYEWSFGMLKDAALLQLELVREGLREDLISKDASAFNIQWRGAQATFIDTASFTRLQPGEPWAGYRQFCQLFLYPLLLMAHKNLPFHAWLRGSIDGIEPSHCNAIFGSLRDKFRTGVLTHVFLQSKLEGRHAATKSDVKGELREAGFAKELILANIKGLEKLVNKLHWGEDRSQWSHYANEHSYSDSEHQAKKQFVAKAAQTRRWTRVWDLGCNTGTFSRIAAEHADCVVSMDADHLAIERFYRELKAENNTHILPLVSNLAEPSPGLGWRGAERKRLDDRGKPELTLCLALIHHVVISANVPLAEFIDWLASLNSALVIEFVNKDDEMVKTLLRNKQDIYSDYTLENFERVLGQYFQVQDEHTFASGTRKIFFAIPASGAS